MISYLLAVLAAVVNAAGNVLNRKAAKDEPAQVQFRFRLFTDLARKPAWLSAIGLMIVSFVLASAALGTGQLASVQLVIILELPMTLIGGSRLFGSRLRRRDWAAVASMTAGVVVLLALLSPRPGPATAVPATLWILGSAANSGAVIVAFLAARANPRPAAQAALLGIAAGLGYGMTAAFTKGMTDQFIANGIGGVISSWQFYACAVAGLASTWLLQNAYQAGPLAASQPGITLVDPVISTLWGVVVFGELVNRGGLLYLAPAPLLAMAAGVLVLSRSPILRATQAGPAARAQDRLAAVSASAAGGVSAAGGMSAAGNASAADSTDAAGRRHRQPARRGAADS